MGKGDPRTAKGKRFKGSFGKSRTQKTARKAALKLAAARLLRKSAAAE
jgi:30S ribosomal protein S31